MSKLLWTFRESQDLSSETWQAFKAKASAAGYSPSQALARLVRRYVARGTFDDGQDERQDVPEPKQNAGGTHAALAPGNRARTEGA